MSNIKKNASSLVENEECKYQIIDNNKNNTNFAENQENNMDCRIYSLKTFMELDLPKSNIILDPIITERSLAMLYAYRGVGKSFFAMSLALAVATGDKFLRWKAPNPQKVLYVDGEMPANMLQERFRKISNLNKTGDYTENLEIFATDLQPFSIINISNTEMQKEITAIIEKKGIKLLILDNLSTLTTLDELDAVSWNTIQEWLITLRKKGVAVIIIHHAGKTGTQRGISKREDILDLVINLRNKASSNNEEEVSLNGKCQVVFEKNRNLSKKQISNFGIELIDVFDDKIAWIDVYSTVQQLKDEGLSCRDIAKVTGISKSRVAEICKLDN